MKTVLVTGSSGLIGSESVDYFCRQGYRVVGIDNDMRKVFFGPEASTEWQGHELLSKYKNFSLARIDIRDLDAVDSIFRKFGTEIDLIIHTAAQPSHDWAARDPQMDFTVNANGTLNLLEACRKHCPKAVFIFTSTNKVYGDTPNLLPLHEQESRWEISPEHPYHKDIDEKMSIDHSKHSLFGASKVAADILVQEYGKYFGMKTASFRGGCLTGPNHSGAKLHGFLSFLMKCTVTGEHYTIYGYRGKQVRDNIHSYDLVNAFHHFFQDPRQGEVYNIGGSRFSNCSMKEAILLCEKISGKKLSHSYAEDNRIGDHIWYISDVSKFESHFPTWKLTKNIETILSEIYQNNLNRWSQPPGKKVA